MPENKKSKSDLILEEVKARKSKKEKIVDVNEETVQFTVVTLKGSSFAFYGRDIKEILPYEKPTLIPGSSQYIPGVVNVRGDIESVVDLSKFLGFPDLEPGAKTKILIAESEGIRSGILVDSVDDVADMPVSRIKPAISTLDKSIEDFVSGDLELKKGTAVIIDLAQVFKRLSDE